jgi:hypothetical protein
MVGALVAVGVSFSIAPIALGADSSGQLAIARAINLRASDVPGFSAHPGPHPTGSPFGAQINAMCSGVVGGKRRRTAQASSPVFQSSTGLMVRMVQSDVQIERSRSTVTHDLAVARSKHTRVCITRVLQGLILNEQGTLFTVTDVRVTPLHVAIPGTNGSFGLRIKAVVLAPPVRIPFSVDLIGLAVGRDEISLTAEGVDEVFPHKTEKLLSQLLVNRALALPH